MSSGGRKAREEWRQEDMANDERKGEGGSGSGSGRRVVEDRVAPIIMYVWLRVLWGN